MSDDHRSTPLRSANGLISPVVAETVQRLPLVDEDVAAAALARHYAALLDDAPVIKLNVQRALDKLARTRQSVDRLDYGEQPAAELTKIHESLMVLAAQVEQVAVAAALGPKLLDALTELGATPKARAALRSQVREPAGRGKLQAMRGGRAG